MIRSTIFNLLFYTWSFLLAMTCWAIALVSTRLVMWKALRVWGRGSLLLMRLILNNRVEVRGRQNLTPGSGELIVSKHQSELDIIMLTADMWDVTAIAMQELEKLPFFGTILRKLECVIVAVDAGPQGRTEQAIAGARRVSAQGRSLVIYPEGELMALGARERYRNGVGRIYEALGMRVVPVAHSLGAAWPQRKWVKETGVTAVMEYMEPIPPGLSFAEFMATIECRIESRTWELIEETATPRALAEARARWGRGINNHGEVVDSALTPPQA